MSTMTKVFVVLTSVVAIALSCLTVATAARWSNQKDQIEDYQRLYQAEFVRRLNMEAVMATSLAMKDDALQEERQLRSEEEKNVSDLTDDLESLRIELARQRNDATAFEAGRKKLEEILEVQTAEITSTRKNYQVLLTEKIDLQTRNQRLASRVLELTSQLTIASDEIRNMQEKLYASEQRVKELQEGLVGTPRVAAAAEAPAGAVPVTRAVAGPIKGEIVQVEGRYVSINVGETSGVVAGMPFMVYRGDTYVGDLKVEKVFPKEAGGKLTIVAPGQSVRLGDRVAYGLD
ncbi:MAG: hypothetical protein KAY37_06165 [Phycisphaerae bacterium]|nr:hypothetical protein [Phycisphaerae bacterium]